MFKGLPPRQIELLSSAISEQTVGPPGSPFEVMGPDSLGVGWSPLSHWASPVNQQIPRPGFTTLGARWGTKLGYERINRLDLLVLESKQLDVQGFAAEDAIHHG